MTDKQILKFTASFTKGILGKRKPHGMCGAVCYPLSSLLHVMGVENRLIEVEVYHNDEFYSHWVISVNDKILDPTANQFNHFLLDKMPNIYFGTMPKHFQQIQTN